MNERRGLLGIVALHEQAPFVGDALVERQGDRSPHSLDTAKRPLSPAGDPGQLFPGLVEDRFVDALHLLATRASRSCRRLAVEHSFRVRDCRRHVIALGDLVDEAELQCQRCRNGVSRGDHLQRPLDADEAREPLRTPRPGQQAELHFRQPKARLGMRDTSLTSHGDLEAAAERGPVHRSDRGFFG